MNTGTERREQSVLTALDELRRLEEERQEAERREAERARAAKAEAARRAEEAEAEAARQSEEVEAHRRRVSEEEARLRVDADLAARDAEAERRIMALRAELARVQAAREAEHLQRLAHLELPQRAPRGRGFFVGALTSGIGALVVALGFTLFAPEPPSHTSVEAVEPATRPEPEALAPAVVAAPEPVVAAPAPVQVAPVVTTRARERPRPRGERPVRPAQGLDLVERCGDDPLCAIDAPRR